MTIRVIIRGYADGALQFEEEFSFGDGTPDGALLQMAKRHTARLLAISRRLMIEFEFPDDPPEQRFLRFGTDPSGMVMPLGVDLRNLP